MHISMIVAMAVNRVIGRQGDIPWKIPGEQKLFKEITLGHCIIMGRKTYESIQRPLPQRTNIIVTRQAGYEAPGCTVAGSLQAALDACPADEDEAFICGGGHLYRDAMPLSTRLYLTILPREVEGDTFFPEIPPGGFSLTSAETVVGPQPYHFLIYDRIQPCQSKEKKKMTPTKRSDSETEAVLLQRLKGDLKDAMRAKDNTRRDAIRQIMAEFPKLTVPLTLESGKKTTRPKKATEISDDDIIGIIRSLSKSEQTVLEITGKQSSGYLEALQAYLPQMADEQTIVAWIRDNIDFTQFANKMQAMGVIMKHFGKGADGKMVNSILKNWQ